MWKNDITVFFVVLAYVFDILLLLSSLFTYIGGMPFIVVTVIVNMIAMFLVMNWNPSW